MKKCIVADSSDLIRLLLVKILTNFGFEVFDADDGEEVIELTRQHSPSLIIMDWNLPIFEGIDVLYKIRSNKNLVQPKIIFCSNITDSLKINLAIQNGADDYIMRPFDEEIISKKLAILDLI